MVDGRGLGSRWKLGGLGPGARGWGWRRYVKGRIEPATAPYSTPFHTFVPLLTNLTIINHYYLQKRINKSNINSTTGKVKSIPREG